MISLKINLIRAKLREINVIVRVWFLKRCGSKIGRGTKVGNIKCDWPSSISIGDNCELQEDILFRIQKPFDKSNFIKIGNRVFIGNDCEFNSGCCITVGDDCLIASNTIFVDGGHETSLLQKIRLQKVLVEQIVIEDDVWIGTNTKVLKGVTIGKGSIIGAGSVVNKSIPPYQIWAGCPAKYLKNR